MARHEAAAQMNGYLYQVRYALYILLNSDNPNLKISIEKFDDIAFEDGFSVKEMIQTKHHIQQGSLKDRSVDLWKTLKVWLDLIDENPDALQGCRFILITTNTAEENSAAFFLTSRGRNEEEAIRLLREVANKHENRGLEPIFSKFLNTSQPLLSALFKSIEIIDNSPTINDVEKRIRHYIRLCCTPEHEEQVLEHVEGWWFRLAIKALTSPEGTLVDFNTARNTVISIAEQYRSDNLPIDRWLMEEDPRDEVVYGQRTFVRQLQLICGSEELLRRAIVNYCRAFRQRSSWIREDLLLPNELDDYEKRLVDEWEQCKAYYDPSGDPVLLGKEIYKELMNKDLRIRDRCIESFVMRGSYEMLSDRLEIGWHRDFLKLLRKEVTGEETL